MGYKKIICHSIFNIKMYLTRKAWYLAVGHLANPPFSMTYAIIASWDSVRIEFLFTALNNLKIMAGGIQNAYLNDPTKGGFTSAKDTNLSWIKEGRYSSSETFTFWITVHLRGGTICWKFLGTLWTSSRLLQTLTYGWNPWQPRMVSNTTHKYWFM